MLDFCGQLWILKGPAAHGEPKDVLVTALHQQTSKADFGD